jgi:SAM-dependent methyltransferase
MEFMAYKLFGPAGQIEDNEGLGQSWREESVEERIALCRIQTIASYFLKFLPKSGKILEAGCGLGRWIFYLKSHGYDITGVELNKTAVDLIHNYDPECPVEQGDVLNLGFSDNYFDAVISLGVMEHFIEGPDAALKETKRVLKNNGLLLLTLPTLNFIRMFFSHPLMDLKKMIKKALGRKLSFYEYRYSKREFTKYLKKFNFEILEIVHDELNSPKNIGLYTDFYFLQNKQKKWELNCIGRMVEAVLKRISINLYSGGTLFVCRLSK